MLAGGCNSPVRAGIAVGGPAFLQERGQGAYAFDRFGKRYIDYIMAYGPLLFGHAAPAFTSGLDELAQRGVLFGSTHAEELLLAERIRSYLPSMERIRFTTTGTEAVMSAVRVARAFTGRERVVRFGGNYHGHFDLALFGAGASASQCHPEPVEGGERGGITRGAVREAIVTRYNDLVALDHAVNGREEEIAAIIVEPIAANMGLVQPKPGFLEGLRARADRFGALLIFDEVITWLRLGLGGAQGRLDVRPDLTTLGKILGGGFPIAAFGGRADVMGHLAPEGKTFTGGTHAGNTFCVAMAHRTLDLIEAHPEYYPAMAALAHRLASGLRSIFATRGLPYHVVQLESIVDFKFRPGETRNWDEASSADARAYAAYYHAMRERGVLLAPSQNEVMFLSTAHCQKDIDDTLSAVDDSLVQFMEFA
ncbi:MAG: aspartate aminotransferase family protein [Candidatus Eremiobacteraeota bacterium]|nr:aspartate aminotransferase family protein [Candidatus Eremiobacteraeota bacterium]